MSNKAYVRGHFRKIRKEKGDDSPRKDERPPEDYRPPRYPRDERKCINYCRYAKKNSQGQLICPQYFDFVPRPFNCEQEGKFAPR